MFHHQALTLLSAEKAPQTLRAGKGLQSCHVQGKLDLLAIADDTDFPYPLVIKNCRIDELDGTMLSFRLPVVLRNSQFRQAGFPFAYFLQGLLMEGCQFEGYLDMQAGGHNKPVYPVCLLRNTFTGFVNFFDGTFEAEVQVVRNVFPRGTNLLGSPQGIPVTFRRPPLLDHNTGDLGRNDEGEEPS